MSQMSENLKMWLENYCVVSEIKDLAEDLSICGDQSIATNAKRALLKAEGIDMLNDDMRNVARHTFATMHCAMHRNFELTASEMGHGASTVMLMKHYKSITTKADAEKFWSIVPEGGAE